MQDQEWKITLLVSICAVVLLLLLSFTLFSSGFKPTYLSEQPLHKTRSFMPAPGDGLEYLHAYGNESESVVFLFGRKPLSNQLGNITFANCTLVAMQGENISTCVSKDGTDGGSNLSLSGPFFFFAPWMLAASENFSWRAATVHSLNGEPLEQARIRALGAANYSGRSALLFEIYEQGYMGNFTRKVWVDYEQRVLLREEGENYTFTLIQAYFPLQPQAE